MLTGPSIDGDSQVVARLHGAVSAHMWPGMVLKSGNRILAPTLPDRQESSDEESDYEAEYEVLSGGSAELWDDIEDNWVSSIPPNASSDRKSISDAEKAEPSASKSSKCREKDKDVEFKEVEDYISDDIDKGAHLELEDLEHLMSDMQICAAIQGRCLIFRGRRWLPSWQCKWLLCLGIAAVMKELSN
ncbi:uncharacterized protein [Spinacia oleracea]|uniref:Uncharacterized protein n=1 Tax=Spinacia oleracea TaxID=3562 RepID=A0ABM3R216_SPIOL|nr:uncharacterized protein LOC110804612 [Spinacia oleracea]